MKILVNLQLSELKSESEKDMSMSIVIYGSQRDLLQYLSLLSDTHIVKLGRGADNQNGNLR